MKRLKSSGLDKFIKSIKSKQTNNWYLSWYANAIRCTEEYGLHEGLGLMSKVESLTKYKKRD